MVGVNNNQLIIGVNVAKSAYFRHIFSSVPGGHLIEAGDDSAGNFSY